MWCLVEMSQEAVTPATLYGLAKDHDLLPESTQWAVKSMRSLAADCRLFSICDEENEVVGTVIVSGVCRRNSADLDLITISRYFRNGTGYEEKFPPCLEPLWRWLFDEEQIRRVTAYIPDSRSRARRALKACGFVGEGRIRDGVQLRGREPEDVYILGLMAQEAKRCSHELSEKSG